MVVVVRVEGETGEEASALRIPSLGLLSVFSGGLFSRSPVARGGALRTTITGEGGGRLTTCESRPSSVWYSLSFLLCALRPCPTTP